MIKVAVMAQNLHQAATEVKHGAGDETRTRDPQLGRLMLYQLSYARICISKVCQSNPAFQDPLFFATPPLDPPLADYQLSYARICISKTQKNRKARNT